MLPVNTNIIQIDTSKVGKAITAPSGEKIILKMAGNNHNPNTINLNYGCLFLKILMEIM